MPPVKELHYKDFEDLDQNVKIPDITKRKTPQLLETAKKLFNEAEKHYRCCDEEKAYIYYMRYFHLLDYINKRPDYIQHKRIARELIGGNTANMQIMNKLEILCKSLKERYEKLQNYSISSKPKHIGSLPSGLTSINSISSVPISSPQGELGLNSYNLITCKELYDHTLKGDVLIMDCRKANDYNISHLTYSWAFNVPEELISKGMSAGKLQDKLDSNMKRLWSARSVKDYVVLMDWNCSDSSPSQNTSIAILRDILQNWDPDVTYRSPIKILEQGYKYFIMMYPTLCTNPIVQAPQENNNDIDIIDDIEYPNIYDIVMKYESNDNQNIKNQYPTLPIVNRPNVDRSSKLAAIKTYNEKSTKPIVEIKKEQEVLEEKARENDKQLTQAFKKWEAVFRSRREDAENITPTFNEQELLYNLMQLENTAEDYKTENDRLREELERFKNIEREKQQTITASEKISIDETARQIESKLQERKKIDEQHEREKQERDRLLAIAREHKRQMQIQPSMPPTIIDEDEISKPLLPHFDRSMKPVNQIKDRYRDFSPITGSMGRGLTGLKNLGNTCYMNSILQCLSNTPQLTEYCISDKYKNYISRNNNTKGQIIEEVAALIKILWNGNYKCVASKDLRYVIGQYQKIFRGIEQQDSHEFLTILMDWLHSDLQTLRVPEKPRDNMTASERAWFEFTKSKESLILHLFYGQIKSTVKCVECNKESATYESFSNLSLELPMKSRVCNLQHCMDMYFNGELITGWNCPSCQTQRDAIKKLDISKLPPVLVVHLKRFYADTDAAYNSYKKKSNYVRFPLENLDMTPYIAKSESRSVTPKTYQLYGVSNHYGSMESGHYTAFCKSGNYDRWFKFDDQVVSYLDTSNVVSSAAYILFYTWLPSVQISDTN